MYAQNVGIIIECLLSKRIKLLIDDGSFEEKDQDIAPADPLKFKDSKRYKDRITAAQKKSGLKDSVVSGTGFLANRPVEIAAMDFFFHGWIHGVCIRGENYPCSGAWV